MFVIDLMFASREFQFNYNATFGGTKLTIAGGLPDFDSTRTIEMALPFTTPSFTHFVQF